MVFTCARKNIGNGKYGNTEISSRSGSTEDREKRDDWASMYFCIHLLCAFICACVCERRKTEGEREGEERKEQE